MIHKSGTYIQMAVSVNRNPKVPPPTFPPGSRFSISKGTTWVEKPAAGDDEEMKDVPAPPPQAVVEEDDEMVDAPAQSGDGRVFTPGPQPKPLGDILAKKPANQHLRKQAAAEAATLAAAAAVRLPKSRSPSPSVEEVEGESLRKGDQLESDEVKLTKDLSAFQMKEKTQFRKPEPVKPTEPSPGEPAGDDKEMTDVTPESLPVTRRQWKATSIGKETDRSFVISFVVDKHELAEFKKGRIYNVTLEMQRNNLPTRRQLNAIALISKGRTDGLKTADIAYNNYLRAFILGKKLPPAPARAPIEDLRPEDRELFDAYVATLRFNRPQQDFHDSVMKSPDNINILQGPPGCGKTFEDASVGGYFSIIGKRTGFFCPTNQACEAIMDALIAERTKILSLDTTKESKIKYIFFPTTSLFKAQLNSLDEDIEGIANDIVDDGDTTSNSDYRPYMLWTHIVNHQKIRGADS